MLKSKGAMIGVAVALAGSVLLLAGMAVSTTSGAGTDSFESGAPVGGFPVVTGPAPAAPTDPAIPGTTPGTTPGNPAGIPGTTDGNAGAGGTAPDALPNAGFGGTDDGNGFGAMIVLLALAGAALVGAGATAASTSRRD